MSPGERTLRVETQAGFTRAISPWVWALEDTRLRTLHEVDGLDQAAIDRTAAGAPHSVGTLLFHLAAIELDWLFVEVLERDEDVALIDLKRRLGHEIRDEDGHLTQLRGVPLAEHLARLAASREALLATLRRMTTTEFRRVHRLPDYNASPEWVVHQLIQHEAEHRGEMMRLTAD